MYTPKLSVPFRLARDYSLPPTRAKRGTVSLLGNKNIMFESSRQRRAQRRYDARLRFAVLPAPRAATPGPRSVFRHLFAFISIPRFPQTLSFRFREEIKIYKSVCYRAVVRNSAVEMLSGEL